MLSLLKKLVGPKPMPLALQPTTGELYGHIFENPRTGLSRDVYWNVRIEFESVTFDGEDWDCSLAVEWVTWPLRRWSDLDGLGLNQVRVQDLVECSFYLFGMHHPATLRRFQLSRSGPSTFKADFSAIADVDDGSGPRPFDVSGKCDLKFSGIIVVAENLQPKPTTLEDAQKVVAKFLSMDDLAEPRSEEWRYILEPLTERP